MSPRKTHLIWVIAFLSVAFTACQSESVPVQTNGHRPTFSLASQYNETAFVDSGGSDWKLYENAEHGFTLRYPPEWNINVLPLPDIDFDFGMSFNFDPEHPRPTQFLYIFRDEIPNTMRDYALDHPNEIQITEVTVGGLPGTKFISSDNPTRPNSPMIEVEHDGTILSFVWAGTHPEYTSDAETDETFNAVIGSLKFTR